MSHNIEPTVENLDYQVNVQVDAQYEQLVDAEALRKLALYVLNQEGTEAPLEMGVVVTTDDEVHALNKEFLGHDYRTDVISFGMESGDPFTTPTEQPPYLGDVVISYDRAAEQGPDYGHRADLEVATLLVHGLLHLLGYDDVQDSDRQAMHARQDDLLNKSGYPSGIRG